jgi:hypothetical protein
VASIPPPVNWAEELTGRFDRSQHRDQVLTVTVAGWVANENDELVPIVASLTNQKKNVAVGSRVRLTSLPRVALERATRLGEDFVVWPTS